MTVKNGAKLNTLLAVETGMRSGIIKDPTATATQQHSVLFKSLLENSWETPNDYLRF